MRNLRNPQDVEDWVEENFGTNTEEEDMVDVFYTPPAIYKISGKTSSVDNPQVLTITCQEEDGQVKMITKLRGGGSPDRDYTKNVLPKPTKSARDVAIGMADQKIRLKLRKDYVESVEDEVEAPTFKPRPQLLHSYDKHSTRIRMPAVLQPKLDGQRCIFDPVSKQLLTRTGKVIDCPGVLSDIIAMPCEFHLDGELYCPDTPLQDTIHVIRSKDAAYQDKHGLGFYVFDMVDGEDDTHEYSARLGFLAKAFVSTERVHLVETRIAQNRDEIETYYQQCVDSGLEGVVVKNMGGVYKWGGRSYDVLKYKPVYDEEFVISHLVKDYEDNEYGGLASYMCYVVGHSGDTFKVTPAMSKEDRAKMWNNYTNIQTSYAGKLLTVEFRGKSNAGVPLHAVAKSIREEGT